MHSGHVLIYVLIAVEGLLSLFACGVIVYHLWKLAQQQAEDEAAENDPSIRRAIERLTRRLANFEPRLADLGLRIDGIAAEEVRQEHERTKWMRRMQDTSLEQLETLRRIEKRDEAKSGLIDWIEKELRARPCMFNDANNGGESCPDGQPIEGAGKMKVHDPNERE